MTDTSGVRRARILDAVGLLARLVLGGVLVVAGALKVGDLDASVLSVRAYHLLPWDVAALVGYGLPIFELILGALILFGVFTRWTALLGTLTMAAFIFGIAWAWGKGLTIDCGCFGDGGTVAAGETKYPQEIVRDILFAAAGIWLVVRPKSLFSVDGWLFAPIDDLSFTEHDDLDETPDSHSPELADDAADSATDTDLKEHTP